MAIRIFLMIDDCQPILAGGEHVRRFHRQQEVLMRHTRRGHLIPAGGNPLIIDQYLEQHAEFLDTNGKLHTSWTREVARSIHSNVFHAGLLSLENSPSYVWRS